MIQGLILKGLPYAVALGVGVLAGGEYIRYTQPTLAKIEQAVAQVPPCPPCNCPATVSLMNFDMDKLNNKRGTFNYSPQLHDVKVVIESKDSTLLKSLIFLQGAVRR